MSNDHRLLNQKPLEEWLMNLRIAAINNPTSFHLSSEEVRTLAELALMAVGNGKEQK